MCRERMQIGACGQADRASTTKRAQTVDVTVDVGAVDGKRFVQHTPATEGAVSLRGCKSKNLPALCKVVVKDVLQANGADQMTSTRAHLCVGWL